MKPQKPMTGRITVHGVDAFDWNGTQLSGCSWTIFLCDKGRPKGEFQPPDGRPYKSYNGAMRAAQRFAKRLGIEICKSSERSEN